MDKLNDARPLNEGSPKARAGHLKAVWRRHEEQLARAQAGPSLRIGMAATFTANSLIPFVGAPLVEAGFQPSIELGPYHQLFQVCLDPKGHFQAEPDVIVLLYRLEDMMLNELLAFLDGDREAFARAEAKMDLLISGREPS